MVIEELTKVFKEELEIFKSKVLSNLDDKDNVEISLTGKGVKIGVIDNYFHHCNNNIIINSKVDINNKIYNTQTYGRANLFCEKLVGRSVGLCLDAEVNVFDCRKNNITIVDGINNRLSDLTKGIKYFTNNNQMDIICIGSEIPITSNIKEKSLVNIKSLYAAIKDSYSKGIIIVVACGDNTIKGTIPARFSEVISVGNFDDKNILTSKSIKIDVTYASNSMKHYLEDGTLTSLQNGDSSSAAACVAGIIALMKEQNKNLTKTDIINLFNLYCDKVNGNRIAQNIIIPNDYILLQPSEDITESQKVLAEIASLISVK